VAVPRPPLGPSSLPISVAVFSQSSKAMISIHVAGSRPREEEREQEKARRLVGSRRGKSALTLQQAQRRTSKKQVRPTTRVLNRQRSDESGGEAGTSCLMLVASRLLPLASPDIQPPAIAGRRRQAHASACKRTRPARSCVRRGNKVGISTYLPTCVRAYVRTYAYPTHLPLATVLQSCEQGEKKTDLWCLLHSGLADAKKEKKIRTEGRVGR
jgi:hypothetical protein